MKYERIVRVEDMGPVERAYAEAMHEGCDDGGPHPLADHSPWSGSDLDGTETWEEFTAKLARHGLTIDAVPAALPFVVRQFEGTPWVPLHEAARLHDAVQDSGLTIAALRNDLQRARALRLAAQHLLEAWPNLINHPSMNPSEIVALRAALASVGEPAPDTEVRK